MAGKSFDVNEIVDLINEEAPAPTNAATMMNDIYGGAPLTQPPITAVQLVELINAALNNDNFVAAVARIMGIRTNEFITELINSHNPYTSDRYDGHEYLYRKPRLKSMGRQQN